MSEKRQPDLERDEQHRRMVELTAWREEMATGNEAIDRQHRDLLNKVEELLLACKLRRMEDEIAHLIWFLKRYVRKHFRDEEKLQRESGFSGYWHHKAEHDAFYLEVQHLEKRYQEEGASTVLVVGSLHMMCDWLHTHLKQMDQALADYLHDIEYEHKS